jgi:hypothetical protein
MAILRCGEGPDFILIAPRVSSTQYGNCTAFVISIFFLLNIVHSQNASADLDGWWLKRRSLVKERVFWGHDTT